MSNAVNDILTDIAVRCNIKNEKILRKSKELLHILNSKQGLNCSDTCRAVVCLELASSLTSNNLSRDEAIKYSGCKKKIYINIYNNISKLLNLDKIYTVKEICLLIGVSDIQESAAKLLEKFKKSNIPNENNFEHPMYPCAAILCFCRNKKIKFNNSKLVEISRVKKQELDELAEQFQKFLEVKKCDEKKKESENESSLSSETKESEVILEKKRATTGVMTDEEYEAWKRKMLED